MTRTLKDALIYLDQVKKASNGQPGVYCEFLEIMKHFKHQSYSHSEVIERLNILFRGHKNLLDGFNQFLPEGAMSKINQTRNKHETQAHHDQKDQDSVDNLVKEDIAEQKKPSASKDDCQPIPTTANSHIDDPHESFVGVSNDTKYFCKVCRKVFKSTGTLAEHLKSKSHRLMKKAEKTIKKAGFCSASEGQETEQVFTHMYKISYNLILILVSHQLRGENKDLTERLAELSLNFQIYKTHFESQLVSALCIDFGSKVGEVSPCEGSSDSISSSGEEGKVQQVEDQEKEQTTLKQDFLPSTLQISDTDSDFPDSDSDDNSFVMV